MLSGEICRGKWEKKLKEDGVSKEVHPQPDLRGSAGG